MSFGLSALSLFLLFSKPNNLIAQQAISGFTENRGQISDQNYQARPVVFFAGKSGPLIYHLRNNGKSYQLSKIESWVLDSTNQYH